MLEIVKELQERYIHNKKRNESGNLGGQAPPSGPQRGQSGRVAETGKPKHGLEAPTWPVKPRLPRPGR